MATVADKSGNGPGGGLSTGYVDREFMKPNRTVASLTNGPWGVTTPLFVGEIIASSADKLTYRAYGAANTQWEQIQRQNLE